MRLFFIIGITQECTIKATENTPQSVTTSKVNKVTLVISLILTPPFTIMYKIYETIDMAPYYTNLIIIVRFFINIIMYKRHIYTIPHH